MIPNFVFRIYDFKSSLVNNMPDQQKSIVDSTNWTFLLTKHFHDGNLIGAIFQVYFQLLD